MPRVKRGNVLQKRHKKILKFAKGFRGSKSKIFIAANQAVMQAWKNAYRDRKKRKRDFRSLWIARINAAARLHGMSYSVMMNGLKRAEIQVNRKMLAELAVTNKEAFTKLAESAKKAVAASK